MHLHGLSGEIVGASHPDELLPVGQGEGNSVSLSHAAYATSILNGGSPEALGIEADSCEAKVTAELALEAAAPLQCSRPACTGKPDNHGKECCTPEAVP